MVAIAGTYFFFSIQLVASRQIHTAVNCLIPLNIHEIQSVETQKIKVERRKLELCSRKNLIKQNVWNTEIRKKKTPIDPYGSVGVF